MGVPEQLPVFWEAHVQDKKQQNWIWNSRLVLNWERSMSDCILSPCLFNWYIEHIMQNARMGDSQAEIKISGRIINNLRYTDDTTLMAEREEELKSLLVGVKEENEKAGLKLSIQKEEVHSIWSHHFMANRCEKGGSQWHILLCWAPKSLHTMTATMKLKQPLDEGERAEWKNWLKPQHSEN